MNGDLGKVLRKVANATLTFDMREASFGAQQMQQQRPYAHEIMIRAFCILFYSLNTPRGESIESVANALMLS